MKIYYSVGHREPCGHEHRTYSGAERCARSFLALCKNDFRQEADDHGQTWAEYRAHFVRGIIQEIHDSNR